MTRARSLQIVTILLAIAIGGAVHLRIRERRQVAPVAGSNPGDPPPAPEPSPEPATPATIGEEILLDYARPGTLPIHDLQLVDRLLLSYRTLVKNHASKPAGANADFVDALCGDNPAGLILLPRSFPHLSDDGELLDRWGSPLFFHPEAASRVGLRSAGPDRRLWTEDDLLLE